MIGWFGKTGRFIIVGPCGVETRSALGAIWLVLFSLVRVIVDNARCGLRGVMQRLSQILGRVSF